MSLFEYLYKKISTEMRMIYLTQSKPKKIVKLDPIDPQDLNIDLQLVSAWSQNNKQLYDLLLANGMAEFICNRAFLNQFYTHLQFMYSGITTIDADVCKLTNLKVLNLYHNKIAVLEHIPVQCRQLYLDFNEIATIKMNDRNDLELLSLSHNHIDDHLLAEITSKSPSLRCLNIAYNKVENIRLLVQSIKKCPKLKILITKNNPISMLALYWEYITTQVALDYFDNQKYVKPEPVKQPPPEPKEEKKQEKKDQKKENKKDTKKGGKVQQKPPEEEKKVQVKVEPPKVKTEQDFTKARFKFEINVLDNVSGTVYDSSIFPQQNLNLKKTQTCFWVVAQFLGKKVSTEENKISMDSILPDGETNRLAFQLIFEDLIKANYENFQSVNKGMTIIVYKEQPQVETDAETGEQKVIFNDKKQIKIKTQSVGGVFVNFESLWSMKKKEILINANLFSQEAIIQPLYKKPFENEGELISKHRVQFDAKIAMEEEQRKKKQQQQEAAKAQKKGGKDTKKAPAKKQAKKDSKQVVGQKKAVAKCVFPEDPQEYRYLGESKMYKCLKERLGIKVVIQ